jgi:hypothetical protein
MYCGSQVTNRDVVMLKRVIVRYVVPLFLLISLAPVTLQAAEVTKEQIKGLDEQVQDIKKDVLELTSELSQLEEKLLFPSNTQVSLFVSLKGDKDFILDSMQIKMDNVVVMQHLYTYKEIEALRAGGVQRIYTGNIKTGDHQLVASFIGRAKSDNEYQRSESFTVTKAVGPKFVEIQIGGSSASDQSITFKDW